MKGSKHNPDKSSTWVVKLLAKIKNGGRRFLAICPFGKRITASIGRHWAYKNNFGKIKFQGQFLQDMIAYLYLPKKKNGFFIDIGAHDGLVGSNTYIFEQLGWKGICVEPQPDIFNKLLKRFRKCDCYNVAISSETNENARFFKAHGASALSGLDTGITETHRDWAREYGKTEIITIQTMTFGDLMNKYPEITEIDFMSIDAEGHEMEILKTINFEKYKFNILTVEANDPERICEFLGDKGYRQLMGLGEDVLFVPKK
jgi:FkbM family methyltransferase